MLALLLVVAAVLGSLIGFERERLLWAAGIRTHMLVCVGACLFMIVSAFGFADSLSAQHVVLDPSRVAAQVVSGIGFLGAGAILARGRNHARASRRRQAFGRLQPSVSPWAAGCYFAAGVSTAIILAILAGVKPLEEAYRDRNQTCRLVIETARGALTPEILKHALKVRNGQIKRFQAMARDADVDDLTVILGAGLSSNDIASFISRIKIISGVTKVNVASRHSGEAERSPD